VFPASDLRIPGHMLQTAPKLVNEPSRLLKLVRAGSIDKVKSALLLRISE
jgi:hypothetical protein